MPDPDPSTTGSRDSAFTFNFISGSSSRYYIVDPHTLSHQGWQQVWSYTDSLSNPTPSTMPTPTRRFRWSDSPYSWVSPENLANTPTAELAIDQAISLAGSNCRTPPAIRERTALSTREAERVQAIAWLDTYEREGVREMDGIGIVLSYLCQRGDEVERDAQIGAARRLALILYAMLWGASRAAADQPGNQHDSLRRIAVNLRDFMAQLHARVDGRIRKEVNAGKYHNYEQASHAFFGHNTSMAALDQLRERVNLAVAALERGRPTSELDQAAQNLTIT